jgi:hypothetical protein
MLKLEVNKDFTPSQDTFKIGGAVVMVTPDVGEDYWVLLSSAFPNSGLSVWASHRKMIGTPIYPHPAKPRKFTITSNVTKARSPSPKQSAWKQSE